MEEQKQNGADQVIGSLQKDFKIVGAHRVHSWYAWAIVGIVFGMALGIVYVANRSGRVVMSEAAQKQGNLAVIGTIDAYAPIIVHRNNPSVWIGHRKTAYATGTQLLIAPTKDQRSTSIARFFKPQSSELSVVGFKGSSLYQGVLASNGSYVIDTTKAPLADLSKDVTFKIRALYQQGSGAKIKTTEVPVSFSAYCGLATGSTRCTSLPTVQSNNLTIVEAPAGIPVVTTRLSLTLPDGKTPVVNKSVIFPAGGGTHTIVFQKNDKTGKMTVKKIVIGPSDTGPALDVPDNTDDGEEDEPTDNPATTTPPISNPAIPTIPPLPPTTIVPPTIFSAAPLLPFTADGTVSVTISSNTPKSQQVAMGAKSVPVLRIQIKNTRAAATVNLAGITITDKISGSSTANSKSSIHALYLMDSSGVMHADPVTPTLTGNLSTTNLNFTSLLKLAPGATKEFIVYADMHTHNSGESISGSTHTFCVSRISDIAGPSTVLGTPACGNQFSIYRSTIEISSQQVGSTTERSKAAQDDIGLISIKAPTELTHLQKITIRFSGSALQNVSALPVSLVNQATGLPAGSASTQLCTTNGSSQCTVTFITNLTVPRYSKEVIKVRIDSTNLTGGNNQKLLVEIQNPADIAWSDGISSEIPLLESATPIPITSISY